MVWGCVLASLIYMWLSNFPNFTCWRDSLFPIAYSCFLCWRLIIHRCVCVCVCVLFLESRYCSFDYMSVSVPITYCFDGCSFVLLSLGGLYLLLSSFFFKMALAVWVFYSSIWNLRLFVLVLWKTVMDILIDISLNLQIALGIIAM